jgi:hypothetical protein
MRFFKFRQLTKHKARIEQTNSVRINLNNQIQNKALRSINLGVCSQPKVN